MSGTLFEILNNIYDKDHNPKIYNEQTMIYEWSKCNNLSSLLTQTDRLYEHIVKWECYKEKQNKGWIVTIFDSCISIAFGYYKYNIGRKTYVDEKYLIDSYHRGERKANEAAVTKMGYKIDIRTIYNNPELLNIESLSNPNFIKKLLIETLNTNNTYNKQWLENNINEIYENTINVFKSQKLPISNN